MVVALDNNAGTQLRLMALSRDVPTTPARSAISNFRNTPLSPGKILVECLSNNAFSASMIT